MANNISFPKLTLELHTADIDFIIDADDYANGNQTSDDSLTDALTAIQTSNDMANDAGAFSIMLSGDFHWDYVINENDIIIIRADPQMGLGSATMGSASNTNIFTGMVSEVHVVGNYNGDQQYYQISGKSFYKLFNNYSIGLVDEAQVSLSSMGWLWDTNADYTPISTSSAVDGDSVDGNINTGQVADDIWKNCRKNGLSKAATAAVMGNAQQETSMRPNLDGASGTGLFQDTGGRLKKYASSKGKDWKQVSVQIAWMIQNIRGGDWYTQNYPMKESDFEKSKDITKATTAFVRCFERAGIAVVNQRVTYAKKFYAQYAKGSDDDSSDSSSADSSDSDSSDSSDGSTSGNVDSTQDMIDKEKSAGIGVAFSNNTVATIEQEIIQRFKPYMRYSYDGGTKTVWDYLNSDGFTSWDADERLTDSSDYTSYSGTLAEMQDDIRVEPFNELFYESDADGRSDLVIRRVPFNQDDWSALSTTSIDSSSIISMDISQSDEEAYSVFVVNPSNTDMFNLGTNSGILMSKPQYNQSLVDLYGYSKLEKTNKYLRTTSDPENASTDSDGVSKDDTKGATAGKAMSYNDVVSFLNGISKNDLRQNQTKYAQELTNKGNNIGNMQAANLITAYINNGYVLSQTQWNQDMYIDQGGGQSNTGTATNNSKNINKVLASSTSQADFLTKAKAKIKNVDDDMLNGIWTQANQNKSRKITAKQLAAIKKDKATATTNGSTADNSSASLVRFTQYLYNWYCENPNFYSGEIEVVGHCDYRIGNRLLVYNAEYKDTFEFYLESVSHSISYDGGWSTTLGVTRGMPQSGAYRFNNLWGQSQTFTGGLMGEPSFTEMAWATDSSSDSGSDDSGDGSGPTTSGTKAAKAAVKKIEDYYAKNGQGSIKYVWGAGRGSTDPFSTTGAAADCSSMVGWLYKDVGYPIGMQTEAIWGNANVDQINGSKDDTYSKLHEGDLVFWDTSGKRGHVGIYTGGGTAYENGISTGLKKINMKSSYWWGYWAGQAARPNKDS